jgi:SAM-dependent methyltransferase
MGSGSPQSPDVSCQLLAASKRYHTSSDADYRLPDKAMNHPILARIYDTVLAPTERMGVRDQRRRLMDGLTGRVVEIGAGTGLNVPLYPATADEIHAMEPDQHMVERLRKKASGSPVPLFLYRGDAHDLPFSEGVFDAAIITFALCTIPSRSALSTRLIVSFDQGGRSASWSTSAPRVLEPPGGRIASTRSGGRCRVDAGSTSQPLRSSRRPIGRSMRSGVPEADLSPLVRPSEPDPEAPRRMLQ